MTKSSFARIALGLMIVFVSPLLRAGDAPVYDKLMSEFAKYEHRLPGSENYMRSLEAVEAALVEAGLEPQRQTFNTIVPETKACVLQVNGTAVSPVYPLGPCVAAPTTTGPNALTGPLVYLGDGAVDQMKDKSVDGCIAVLDFSSPNMRIAFMQGAKAVVFVGDDKATQWQVANHFSTLPMSIPRVYVDRSVAQQAGLLDPSGKAEGALRIETVWKPVEAVNLWCKIPGVEGAKFELGVEEAVCFSAVLDTFGAVPDRSPSMRTAANSALLAQVASEMAGTQPKRSAYFVWFGSHYAAQDGARLFFYAVDKATPGGYNIDPLDLREEWYQEGLADLDRHLDLLRTPGFLASGDENLFGVIQLLRRKLTSHVNNFNFRLRDLAIRVREGSIEEKAAKRKELDLRHSKRIWNDLKRQLLERTIDEPQPKFTENQVLDWREVAVQLSDLNEEDANSIQKRLWGLLGAENQRVIQDAAAKVRDPDQYVPEPFSFEEKEHLIESLNTVVASVDFAEVDDFKDIESVYDIEDLLSRRGQRLSEAESQFLNRLLIERAIGDGVARCVLWKNHFQELVEDVEEDLLERRMELSAMLRHNRSHQNIVASVTYEETDKNGKTVQKPRQFVAHLGFDFASDEAPWFFTMLGEPHTLMNPRPTLGPFLKYLNTFADLYKSLTVDPGKATLHLPSLSATYDPTYVSTPMPRSLTCVPAQAVQIPGFHMITAGDPLNEDGLPVRTSLSLAGLVPTMREYARIVADAPELSLRSPLQKQNFRREFVFQRPGGSLKGTPFSNIAQGSTEIEGPAKDAIVVLGSKGTTQFIQPLVGHTRSMLARVDAEGYVFMPFAASNLNSNTTNNCYAIGFDETGQTARVSMAVKPARLFYTYGGSFFRSINFRSYDIPSSPTVLNARNDARFKNATIFENVTETVVLYDYRSNFKYIGNGLALLGSTDDNPRGYGISRDPQAMVGLVATRRSADDYSKLNQKRLTALRQRNVSNNSVERLRAEVSEQITFAKDARAAGNIPVAMSHETFATGLGFRAYTPLKATANDMVNAVVILMILSIPFAFAMERLVFGFTTIYRQISGFTGLFLFTFFLLYISHPAFQLADAPIMIFLAFVIILLSGLVVYIVMSKFRQEIKAMQGLVSKVHAAQSDSSTALASVLIGISGMRNRPLKTFLTAATVVLLTFTILVFASFTSKLGVLETYLGQGHGTDRIEIHRPSFLDIPRALRDSIRFTYEDEYEVCERVCSFYEPLSPKRNALGSPTNLIYVPRTGKTVSVKALLGLEVKELELNKEMHEVVPEFVEEARQAGLPPIFFSDQVVRELDLTVGEEISIRGTHFRFAGEFDNSALQNFVNIDETRLRPPDYKATTQENEIATGGGDEQLEQSLENIDISSYVWTGTTDTAITTTKGAEALGGLTNHLTLYPKIESNIARDATAIARIFRGPVFSKGATGANQYFFTRALQESGTSEIIVPLLLGGLIIFSSLLGSIVDREKEIFTYSALGLAPPDVAALFFAESSVYAVIGGVGGYLISQLVAKFLSILSETGLFYPPEMNFSSLSSIYTILLVMATVILSTIYPAIKAGKSANPGVARKWRMPEPEGDILAFVFPFTVSEADLAGVLSYIQEHLDSHRDASLGNFAARDIALFRTPATEDRPESLGVRATLSLAPFDLGVFQNFKLYSAPSDIEGIDEVIIELTRLSGPPGTWVRSNRKFIDELRNQFLLWRSLPVETVEHYRQQTEAVLGKDATA